MPTEVAKPGEIPVELSYINDELNGLGQTLVRLEEAVRPVLGPESDKMTAPANAIEKRVSAVGSNLADIRSRIIALNVWANSIINRVAV